MKHHRTCCLCEALCGLEIEHDGHTIKSIRGNPADPLSQGHVCPKATALEDLHNDPDRLKVPHRRDGDRWIPMGWDEALDEVAARLHTIRARYGDDALGIYVGNPTVHNFQAVLSYALLQRALPTRNRFSATSADQLPHMFAAAQMFGHQLMLPIPDIDRTDLMIIVGGNPAVSNGSLMTAPGVTHRLKAIQSRGGRVVVIDPRRTRTAELADEHHFIRPGTDAFLFLSMLHTLFAEDLIAHGPWRAWTDNLHQIHRIASRFSPEQTTHITRIPPETARQLARSMASARGATLYGRLGVSTQRYGGLSVWLINVLNIVTGHLDQPGGTMFTQPVVDVLQLAATLDQLGSFDRWRSRTHNLPEFNGELPVSALIDEIETPGPRQIKALLTMAGNPVLSTPNGAMLSKALNGLEFIVSFDPYINATTRHADIIIPPLSQLERDHFGLVFHALAVRNTVSYSKPLFDPSPDARDDWQSLIDVALRVLRLQRPSPHALTWRTILTAYRKLGPRNLIDLLVRIGPEGALRKPLIPALTLDKILESPHGIDLGPLRSCLPGRLFTPNKRINLAPDLLIADVARLDLDLRASLEVKGDKPLLLIGRRDLRSNNSWMHNAPRLMRGDTRCTLLMHPDDASDRGLKEGQRVTLSSRVGAVEVPLVLDDGIMPGVVSLPHGWGHASKGARMSVANAAGGVSLNDITDELFVDALTGNAGFNGVPVEVVGRSDLT